MISFMIVLGIVISFQKTNFIRAKKTFYDDKISTGQQKFQKQLGVL